MKRVDIIVAGSAYPMDDFKSGLGDLGGVEGVSISLSFERPRRATASAA
jgi:hypothetical protein